jgi:U32 family peptidase
MPLKHIPGKQGVNMTTNPLILAPAGNRAAFLAALAAGADAVYCGLKHFSARMEAKNFTIFELARLTKLAHAKKVQVYVTLNSLVKSDELDQAAELLSELISEVHPDALIIQDLAFLEIARQMGFKGEIHLSTLSNVTFPAALYWIKTRLNINRIVLPRELNVDEIKAMAAASPKDLDLETFIHGALCYGVSGRCYWSSWLGGKSGLRGQCVQPCRRLYQHQKDRQRYFSCQDFSIDVLVKVLKGIQSVRVWKIEGRKKGPHYVYYTVLAYQLLRDYHHQAARKRDALALLDQSLGRRNSHFNFLSQRPQNPIRPDLQTGSGLLLGRIQGSSNNLFLTPRVALLPNDVLRIGYEDQSYHRIINVRRHVPKKGRLHLKIPSGKINLKGTPIFLTDRKEKALDVMLAKLALKLDAVIPPDKSGSNQKTLKLPVQKRSKQKPIDLTVFRHFRTVKRPTNIGLWLSITNLKKCSQKSGRYIWWWLPPVIWPSNQKMVMENLQQALSLGSRAFVLNAPWQMALFSNTTNLVLWAGPFCNVANHLSLSILKSVGFGGVIVSPELRKADYKLLARNAPLPLGIVLSGHWPLCISRIISNDTLLSEPFKSPKGEIVWVNNYDDNYWVFANWRLDLNEKKKWLERVGYRLFIDLNEPIPLKVNLKKRPGVWNWDIGLK